MTTHTLDELKQEVSATATIDKDAHAQEIVEKVDASDAIDRAHKFNKMKAFADRHRNKARWSVFLMFIMGGMLSFQCLLLLMVGLGYWNFTPYPWLIQSLMVTNFAEIAALALVIVKALHDHYKD